MPLLLPTYDIQLRQMQRRTQRRFSRRLAGALVIYWTLAIILFEIARSVTRFDYPSELTGHAYFFGLIYVLFPQFIIWGIVCFHLYWVAAITRDAASLFLRRKGIESDLLSITSGGTYSYVVSRFIALCRKFLPHMIVLAFAYWGSAVIISFESYRGMDFDLNAIFTGDAIPPIRSNFYFPSIPDLLMAGVLPLITLSGMLMVYSALALLVVATTKYFQPAIMIVLRIITAAVILFAVRPTVPSAGNLGGVLDYAIFSFTDGGIRMATGAFGRFPIFNNGTGMADPAYAFYVWASAVVFLLMCVIIAGILLELTVRRLRRR